MKSRGATLQVDPTVGMPFRTAGEWAAHLRWRGLVVHEAGVGERIQEIIGGPIDRLEAKLFGTEGVSLADRGVVAGMRQLAALSHSRLPVDLVLNVYRERGHEVSCIADVCALSLDDIDDCLRNFDEKYLVGASVGGALTGAFGALGVVSGIPPLLLASLHAIDRLALFHGHDPREAHEEHFSVLVLATSLISRPILRGHVLQQLQAVARELESRDALPAHDPHSQKITENVAESLALQLVLGLLTRSWPLVGLVVGAGYSRAFVARACDTARAAYGQRALLRRYGDLARVEPKSVRTSRSP
jgi:hypothetical protein